METTHSSAWRWTRPCPVRLVRWGNNEGRWYQIKGSDLPYVRDNDNSCSIMALWHNSTTSLLLVFTPFGYWFLYFHLSLYYFIISKFLAPSFFIPYSTLLRISCILYFPYFSSFFCFPFCYFPFAILARFPLFLRCWPLACVYVCVCSRAWSDLPGQWAPARLTTSRRRRGWEQQRHAGHRGRSGVLCSTVTCHQLPSISVWISVWQHEWWERMWRNIPFSTMFL